MTTDELNEILSRIKDGTAIADACIGESIRSGSTSATVALLRLREIIEGHVKRLGS